MAEEQPKAEAGGTNELAGLSSRVDELGNLFKEWEAARGGAARTRIGVVLAILIGIVLCGYVFYSMFSRVQDPTYQKELAAAVRTSAREIMQSASPQVMKAAGRLRPIYVAELKNQMADNRADMRERLYAEADALSNNLADKLESTLRAKLDGLAAKQKAKISEAFPAIKDDEDLDTIIKNLDAAVKGAALDVLADRLTKSKEQLVSVTEKVLNFLPEERRESFHGRMQLLFEHLALEELRGKRFLQEDAEGSNPIE